MRFVPALLAAATLSLAALPAQGQEMADFSKVENAEIRDFAANNSLFVLYHEVGHLLFDQLNVPILGREEDAADNFASWILLNKDTPDTQKTLQDAADGWLMSGVAYESGAHEEDFAAAHSLDKQRAYQIVCLMVGSDDKAFQAVANQYAIGRDRQDSCYWDYAMVTQSFERLLGARTTSEPGENTKVHVTYHTAGGNLRFAADAFRSSGIFDQVAEELRSHFRLPNEVRFNAQRCGEANAFYDPDTVEVIFCYELMKDYMDLYISDLSSVAETRADGSEKTKTDR